MKFKSLATSFRHFECNRVKPGMFCLRLCALLIAMHLTLPPLLDSQQASDCLKRIVTLGVRDQRSGSFRSGLDSPVFRGELGHKLLNIQSVSRQSSSPRLILLVDTSGSMIGNGKWKIVAAVANEFVSEAPADAEIALGTFTQSAIERAPLNSERNALIAKVRTLPLPSTAQNAQSAILDSIMTAADWFQGSKAGDAIYVITDGDDNGSRTDLKAVRRRMVARAV